MSVFQQVQHWPRNSRSHRTSPKIPALLLLCLSSAILVAVGVFFLTGNVTVLFACLSMSPFYVSMWRVPRYGLLDALGLFAAIFAIYNGVLLLRFATMGEPGSAAYPIKFSAEIYEKAGLLGALASLSIVVTAIGLQWLYPSLQTPTRTNSLRAFKAGFFESGFVTYVLGILMYVAQYSQHGGYWHVLSGGRGAEFETFRSGGLSWPYAPFVCSGLVLMFYQAENGKRNFRRWMARVALGAWVVALLLSGERSLVLQALLAVAAVSFGGARRILKLSKKRVTVILICCVTLAVFGQARGMIAPVLSGETSGVGALASVEKDASTEWIYPEKNDMAGPYLSLLYFSARSGNDIHPTNSYVDSLLFILPRAIYPGQKPTALVQDFADSMHRGVGPAPGWGFSSVAEAYVNFGATGIVAVFAVWTLLFFSLDQVKHHTPAGLLMFSVLLGEVITVNRMDFRCVYSESIYLVGAVGFGLFLSSLMRTMIRRRGGGGLSPSD